VFRLFWGVDDVAAGLAHARRDSQQWRGRMAIEAGSAKGFFVESR